jgi:hypothetical protein
MHFFKPAYVENVRRAEAAQGLLELTSHFEYCEDVVDLAQRHATAALRSLGAQERAERNDRNTAERARDCAWSFYTRLWEADLPEPGGPCIANATHAAVRATI